MEPSSLRVGAHFTVTERMKTKNVWFGPNGFSLRSPTFFALGTGFVEDSFCMDWERVNGFGMIQAHHTYHACFYYYYYISSTSARKALGPGGQRPLLDDLHLTC